MKKDIRYSETHSEHYEILKGGDVIFKSGVKYSPKEIEFCKQLNEPKKKVFHSLKKYFKAEAI